MSGESVTLTIEAGESSDELTVPAMLLDMLREDEGETDPQVVGDIAMLGLAQRIHTAVHHSEGEPDAAIADVHDDLMENFEARFGQSFGELTGHSH